MPKAKDAEEQLASFMAKFTPEIGSQAKAIRAEMRKLYPTALELVYDNYNALAIGYGPTERASEAIFSIALYPRWVSLFFLQGAALPDPDKILERQRQGRQACGAAIGRHVEDTVPSRIDARGRRTSQSSLRPVRGTSPHHQVQRCQTAPPPSALRKP